MTERTPKPGGSPMHRRKFMQAASGAALLSVQAQSVVPVSSAGPIGRFRGPLCLFSKHLPEMGCRTMARELKALGFDGVDLTARSKGHVAPERAREELPKAVADIRGEGLSVPMISTELTTASDPTARPILSTAGQLGIPFFKIGYYRYQFKDILGELGRVGEDLAKLTLLAGECGIQGGFHNHTSYVGSPVWDAARIIDPLDPKWIGYYFDIRHAVAEGGGAGWKIATLLVAPRLKMIAVKDFFWQKGPRGWAIQNCPLGEGMVNWKEFFSLLAAANFQGPVSLHLEYEIPGTTRSEKEANTLSAAKKDLEFLRARFAEAYA